VAGRVEARLRARLDIDEFVIVYRRGAVRPGAVSPAGTAHAHESVRSTAMRASLRLIARCVGASRLAN
jgi:hypothetical protein